MQIITTYDRLDSAPWLLLLQESPTASWFQSPMAYEFYASLPTLMTPFVVAVTEGDDWKGVVTGYITQERNAVKQFFSRRAIVIGGPALAPDITPDELAALLNTLKQQLQSKAIYVETRNFSDFSPWRTTFEQCGFCYQPHYDACICCEGVDDVATLLAESKRRQLNKALKQGFYVTTAKDESEVMQWYALLRQLYRTKIKRPLWHIDFFLKAWQSSDFVLLLVKDATHQIVGGALCPIHHDKVIYEWYVCGPLMATYAIMQYAQANGMKKCDLMGAGIPNKPYGVRDFKQQMGATLYDFGRYQHIFQPALYHLGATFVKLAWKNKN
ncbi:MAG: GNAT family N-acetyltransferase [Bacteroidales bacterium]|nr:GNAT family N-acetyltransferase [Bacteroidales bacterium]